MFHEFWLRMKEGSTAWTYILIALTGLGVDIAMVYGGVYLVLYILGRR